MNSVETSMNSKELTRKPLEMSFAHRCKKVGGRPIHHPHRLRDSHIIPEVRIPVFQHASNVFLSISNI